VFASTWVHTRLLVEFVLLICFVSSVVFFDRLPPVSCVHNVANVSRLSILGCPFGFLEHCLHFSSICFSYIFQNFIIIYSEFLNAKITNHCNIHKNNQRSSFQKVKSTIKQYITSLRVFAVEPKNTGSNLSFLTYYQTYKAFSLTLCIMQEME